MALVVKRAASDHLLDEGRMTRWVDTSKEKENERRDDRPKRSKKELKIETQGINPFMAFLSRFVNDNDNFFLLYITSSS